MAADESLAQLGLLHTSFGELVRDAFGLSILNETIEPMIGQAQRLLELTGEAHCQIATIDQMLADLRAMEPVEP